MGNRFRCEIKLSVLSLRFIDFSSDPDSGKGEMLLLHILKGLCRKGDIRAELSRALHGLIMPKGGGGELDKCNRYEPVS